MQNKLIIMKKNIYLFILLFVLVSCAGTVQNRKMSKNLVENVKNKQYEEALKIVKNKDFYPQENSKLLKNLETGTVYYLNGDYYQALQFFEKAKKISDDLYTISIKNKIKSGWDANLDDYYGELYERSLIRFYISLINYNIFQQGFYEEYTDEEGKIIPQKELQQSEKLFHLNYSRSAIIEWDSLLKTMQNETAGENIYKNDMMAKIWGAFIHSEFNDSADRQISLQLYRDADKLLLQNYNMYPIFNAKSEKFNDDFKKLPNLSLQQLKKDYIIETEYSKDLQEFIARNTRNIKRYRKDNLVILLKDNLIAPKTVKNLEIPLPLVLFGSGGEDMFIFATTLLSVKDGIPYILIEIPEIINANEIRKFTAVVYDKNNEEVASTDLTLIEPLSDIAKKTLDDKAALIQTAIVSRITAKYIAAISAAYALYSQDNSFAKLGAIAAFTASTKAINESSRADIRYWTTLTSDIQMGGIRLKNGEYILKIFSNDKKIFEKTINIINGRTTFIDLNF